ncbi:hypothetical protein LBMAG53_04400 [Planctomycetota bacterium]|nr:hypothetical protein LBMAG53_04400 [Planctomycetota bacterium]
MHPPIIDALAQIARKRRLLDRDRSDRLADYAIKNGVATLADLRTWLDGKAAGLGPELCQRLLGLLAPADLPAFGNYQAFVHLADGGMGRVWLAAAKDGPLVVVKTLKSTTNLIRQRRFEREVEITRKLNHPNIVRCLDGGEASDGSDYLVLEYVDSGDLRELVEARWQLPEPLTLAIVAQVADALKAAHALNVVHRDIKPSNIFVGHDGKSLLADFGIARAEGTGTMLTMAGAIMGSPQFMSPEQSFGQTVDIRSDIYAVGAVLFYCLAGRPPFDGTMQDVMYQQGNVPAPDVRTACSGVSERTAQLIAACLAKPPGDRPADPQALRSALEDALVAQGLNISGAISAETSNTPGGGKTIGFSSGVASFEFPTIDSDLSGNAPEPHESPANPGQRTDPIVLQHLTASLLAQPPAAEPADTGSTSASGNDSGSPSVAARASGATDFAGDPALAITGDWISLLPQDAGDPTAVLLFARSRLVLGKLRGAPSDLCLRNYPVAEFKDALQRISRQHVALRYDPLGQECLVEDLGSANGTVIDGVALASGKSKALGTETAHVLVVAGTVSLWVRCRRSTQAGKAQTFAGLPPAANPPCGLDSDLALDSVILTRPENRPEMAYAMVLRRMTLGGPGADLELAGARSRAGVTVAHYAGRWLYRPAAGNAPWKPLTQGQVLDCGGRNLVAQVGQYEHF